MAFQVVHGNEWLFECEGQRLGVADADQQSSGKSRSLGHRKRVNGVVGCMGFGESITDDRHNGAQMLT